MSQNGLTRSAGAASRWKAGISRNRNDAPMKKSPKANLAGVDGSRCPSAVQSQAKMGESRMTKMAWMLRNQLDGKLKPMNDVSV